MYLLFKSLNDIERDLLSVCVSELISEYVLPVYPEEAKLESCVINGHELAAISPSHKLGDSSFHKEKGFIKYYGSDALPFKVITFLMDVGMKNTERNAKSSSDDDMEAFGCNGTMYCSRQFGGFQLFDTPSSCSSSMSISLSLADVTRSDYHSAHHISSGLKLVDFQLSGEQYVRFMRSGEFGTPCTIYEKDRYRFDHPVPKFHAVHLTADELMKDMTDVTKPLRKIQEELVSMLKDSTFTSKKSLLALEEKVNELDREFRNLTPIIGRLKNEAADKVVEDFKNRLLKQAQIELQTLPEPVHRLLFIPSM
ncbi:hypothetical protein ACTG16_22325 [Aeromonas sp. 23P]|uniref:hypothetical protein n=1 Tax=Aeromonas sp. 23P TaxID=3452716 RepID=UPI003F795823